MRACHHVAGRLLAIALAAALGLLARPAVALPRPTPDAVQAAALTPALRRCLLRLDARLVDGSSPAALAEAAGGRLWSAVHSRTVPLAVVFPRTATAVGRAVRCAKRAGVKVTARSGGGSFLGYSVRPGTLTLDLSELDGVTVAQNRRSVRVQGGARLGQLYYHVYKQAGPGVAAVAGTCPNVGVGGHILGGGYGFLTPWHGLACDQLLSVTMVDANGDLVTASRGKNADLFAASCGGGGGNFGIATEFRLRLHQAPALFSLATFKIAAAHAVDFLVHWQSRLLPSASSKLLFELHLQPDGTVSVVAFLPGRRAALDEELARLGVLQSPWLPGAQLPKGSTSELSWIEAMVVTAGSKARNSSLQALLDFDYMVGRRPAGFAEKSWFALKPLPRRAFPAIFAVLRKTDATVTVLSTGLKTAVRRRRQRDTAFPWRRALYFMKAAKRVRREADVPLLAPALAQIQRQMAPFFPRQPAYINYIDDQASPDPLWSYYGPNLGWLRQVKAKFDPDGFFNTNPVAIPAAATNRQQPATAPQ